MTQTWSDPIPVNGKRPKWLADKDIVSAGNFTGKHWREARHIDDWQTIDTIQIVADHWAAPVIAAGMEPWPGGEQAPEDWVPGTPVMFQDRTILTGQFWCWLWTEGVMLDIIGYTKLPEPAKSESTSAPANADLREALELLEEMYPDPDYETRERYYAFLDKHKDVHLAQSEQLDLTPWVNFRGPLPDYDHPLRPVYESGIQYAVELLAQELGVKEWEICDGTEEFDGDLGGTMHNIVRAALPRSADGEHLWPSEVAKQLAERDTRIVARDAEIAALREALSGLLNACYQADGCEELSEQIDGSLLDAAATALKDTTNDQ